MRRASILAALAGRGLSTVEIAAAIGCSRRRAHEHIRRLVDDGTLEIERKSTGRGGAMHIYTIARPRVPLLQRVWTRYDHPQP